MRYERTVRHEADPAEVAALNPEDEAVLDNPVWHALTGEQRPLGSHRGLAGRFDADVSPFGGFAGPPTEAGWREMAAITGPAGRVAIVDGPGRLPPGWSETWTIRVLQMVADRVRTSFERDMRSDGDPDELEPIVPLGRADVDEMLELTGLARPGPFLPRTVEFGGYVGIRRGDRLVAMAGERLRPPGFAEVSAVSTHPDHRGEGLGARMVETVTRSIMQRGERPFLHVAHDNETAIRLYASLGFSTRREFVFTVVEGPDAGH